MHSGKTVFEVRFHVLHRFAVGEQDAILKVVIETSEIEVDGSAQRHAVIRNELLGVTEARRVLEDSHPVSNQPLVVGTGHRIDGPLCPEFPA